MVRRGAAVALIVRNLAAIAAKVEKSKLSYLSLEMTNYEADMTRRMKRRVILNVKRVVLQWYRDYEELSHRLIVCFSRASSRDSST
jgi:hypothetical protein